MLSTLRRYNSNSGSTYFPFFFFFFLPGNEIDAFGKREEKYGRENKLFAPDAGHQRIGSLHPLKAYKLVGSRMI